MPCIVILGASANKDKHSNKAVRAYLSRGYKVVPVNPKHQFIEELKCVSKLNEVKCKIDVISVYVPPQVGERLAQDIINAKPEKVHLNPGTESIELINTLRNAGINTILECSIKALGINPELI